MAVEQKSNAMADEAKLTGILQAIREILDQMLQDKKECAHLVHYLFSRIDENHPLYQEVHRIVFLLADVRSLLAEARDVSARLEEVEKRFAWPEDD